VRALAFGLILLAGGCAPAAAVAGPIPSEAQRYQRELVRQVHQVWGLDGPVALHAAQVHQESAWRAGVDSPVGAQGMAQFMPATAAWMAELYPELGEAAPYSPSWALAAMARYNRRIYNGLRPMQAEALPRCDRLAMMLSGYNGGPGWVSRDRRLAAAHGADPDRWWGEVEHYTNRADWARRENRRYPQRIIFELEPRYLRAGWPGRPSCPSCP
jgi:soluble lytic murein transglycosylase-like protein